MPQHASGQVVSVSSGVDLRLSSPRTLLTLDYYITGRVQKPTGSKNLHVEISGNYVVSWSPVKEKTHYTLIEVNGASDE